MGWHHYVRKGLEDLDEYIEARENDPHFGPRARFTMRTVRTFLGKCLTVIEQYRKDHYRNR